MSIILFIAILAILVLSHEFGHFIFAKISKVKVEEFAFGFPPKIFSFRRGETVYSLNLIPFGGFVKIYGEEAPKESPNSDPTGQRQEDKRSFANKSLHIRASILIAGVLFNLLLVWPILTAGYLIGAPVSVENNDISGGNLSNKGVMIIQVQENTPAESAGLKTGDYILSLSNNNKTLEISDLKSVQDFIAKNAGNEIKIDYLRGGKGFSAKATPLINPEAGKGNLGIAMDYVATLKLPFYRAVWEGLKTSLSLIGAVFNAFVNFFAEIFMKKGALTQIAGPVGIARIVSNASQSGFIFILQLIALLSVNLALINIFPFPALDGGRLLF